MKLTKKMIVFILTLMIATSIGSLNAYAWAESTYATKAPNGVTGEWAKSETDNTVTTPTSDAKGSDIKCYYKPATLKSLPSSFKASNDRALEIWAMEDDPTGDDHFKTYSGKFSGRSLTKITLTKTNISGSVEPNASVELYIKQNVHAINGDGSKNYTSLFSFYWSTL